MVSENDDKAAKRNICDNLLPHSDTQSCHTVGLDCPWEFSVPHLRISSSSHLSQVLRRNHLQQTESGCESTN